jgi:hypothetical protein
LRHAYGIATAKCLSAGAYIQFDECTLNRCVLGSDNRDAYVVEVPVQGTVPVFSLGTASCASDYTGVASVTCPIHHGPFNFSGCVPKCSVGSGNRIGYTIPNPNADTERGLGAVGCNESFSGTAAVVCNVSANVTDFQFHGCEPNICTAGSGQTDGYVITGNGNTATTVLQMEGKVQCKPTINFGGTPEIQPTQPSIGAAPQCVGVRHSCRVQL